MPERLAEIAGLVVYPIKSMAGVLVEQAHVGLDGIFGDRIYSFVRADQAAKNSFPWMTARESSRMLMYKPEFAQEPTPEQQEPEVRVRTPDGELREAGDPELCAELTSQTGQPMFLLKSARGIFDCQHLSLFSEATVRALAIEADTPIDTRQFRANIYLEPASGQAFAEESWTNCLLQIGNQVIVGVTKRDTRCMMVNLNPDTGTQNPRVLKAIAQNHQRQAGLYANVVRPGFIRTGDSVELISKL